MPGIFGSLARSAAAGGASPRASAGGGVMAIDLHSPEMEAYMRGAHATHSGAVVSDDGALRVATAWRCVHILAGVCGNLPLDLYRRVDERRREPAAGHRLREVLTRRPNGWNTPAEFRKMLTAWAVLEGNGYALKVPSLRHGLELWGLNSRRMEVVQNDDMTLSYVYTRKNGTRVPIQASDVMHLRGLTLDGVRGLGVIRYAREALGLALQTEKAGAKLFKQGVLTGGALKSPGALSDKAYDRLKSDIEEQRSSVDNAHKWLILEEGTDFVQLSMTAEDAQFLETRKFQRSDICMFFGVPPFMVGDVEKTTSWGSGVEQMATGFVQFSAQDWITMWEQTIARDLLTDPVRDANIYARLDPRGLLRGDMKGRAEFYAKALGSGGSQPWMVPNEVRGLEDLNPIEGGDELPKPSPAQPPAPGQGSPDDPSPDDA